MGTRCTARGPITRYHHEAKKLKKLLCGVRHSWRCTAHPDWVDTRLEYTRGPEPGLPTCTRQLQPGGVAESKTKGLQPYEIIGFGTMGVTKACKFMRFGAIDVNNTFRLRICPGLEFGRRQCRSIRLRSWESVQAEVGCRQFRHRRNQAAPQAARSRL